MAENRTFFAYLQENGASALFWIIGIAVLAALGYGVLGQNVTLLDTLRNAEVARGLITFLIVVTTVAIGIILVLYVVVAEKHEEVKERFAYGKEVLTTLIGILGTILGFYFGSADKTSSNPDVAEIKLVGAQLLTHVSGGSGPYRYSVQSNDKPPIDIKNRISRDGWIDETLVTTPAPGSVITVEIVDNKDRKVSTSVDVPSQPAKAPPAPPAGATGAAPAPAGAPADTHK